MNLQTPFSDYLMTQQAFLDYLTYKCKSKPDDCWTTLLQLDND